MSKLSGIKQNAYISLLKQNSDFVKLFLAQSLSRFGNQLHRFGFPWIVYDLTGSAELMALNFSISLLPNLLFGMMGGVLADKFNKKKILIYGDLLSSIITVIIVLLNYNYLNAYSLLFFTFLLSTINSVYLPAFQSILPSVVSKENLMNANSLFSITNSFINLAGPVIAGMIIGFIGPFTNIGINSLTFLLSAICIAGIKAKSNSLESKKGESIFKYVKSSLSYIKKSGWLLRGIILNTCVYLGAGGIGSLIQFYLRDIFKLNGQMVGISFGLFEFLPMFLMGYLTPYICKKFNYEKIMIMGSLLYSTSMILLGFHLVYGLFVMVSMILNASMVLLMITWQTMWQERTPEYLLGRISGAVLNTQFFTFPLGGFIAAYLVNFISIPLIIMIFGIVVFIATCATYIFIPVSRLNYHNIDNNN